MSRPAGVLFDLDDTLYRERDFVDGGFAAVAGFLAPITGSSSAELTARLIALHDNQGRGRLFDTVIEERGLAADRDLVLACLLVYRTHRPSLQPFPGVVEALRSLRAAGVRTGLVSDGHSATQHRKLAALPDVERELDAVVMTADIGEEHAKPSPVPFRVACRLLAIQPSETVYVANDSRKDFIGARAAGLRTIRVGGPPDEGHATMTAPPPDADADLVVGTVVDAVTALLAEGDEP
jgi:putative hydrolase of the HAD superfamily